MSETRLYYDPNTSRFRCFLRPEDWERQFPSYASIVEKLQYAVRLHIIEGTSFYLPGHLEKKKLQLYTKVKISRYSQFKSMPAPFYFTNDTNPEDQPLVEWDDAAVLALDTDPSKTETFLKVTLKMKKTWRKVRLGYTRISLNQFLDGEIRDKYYALFDLQTQEPVGKVRIRVQYLSEELMRLRNETQCSTASSDDRRYWQQQQCGMDKPCYRDPTGPLSITNSSLDSSEKEGSCQEYDFSKTNDEDCRWNAKDKPLNHLKSYETVRTGTTISTSNDEEEWRCSNRYSSYQDVDILLSSRGMDDSFVDMLDSMIPVAEERPSKHGVTQHSTLHSLQSMLSGNHSHRSS